MYNYDFVYLRINKGRFFVLTKSPFILSSLFINKLLFSVSIEGLLYIDCKISFTYIRYFVLKYCSVTYGRPYCSLLVICDICN